MPFDKPTVIESTFRPSESQAPFTLDTMAAQENANPAPRRRAFANLDDAPQHLQTEAASRVAPVITEIKRLRQEVAVAETKETRQSAAMTLKNARVAAATELRASIKAARKKAAEEAHVKIENDSDLVVARIALQRFRDALKITVAGPPINTIDASTATKQQLANASIVANEVISRIRILLTDVISAPDKASRQRAQSALKTARETEMKQLQCARIAARAAFDVADNDEKADRREDLIKARLVIELVRTEIKQFRDDRKRKRQSQKEQVSATEMKRDIIAEAEAAAAAAISILQPYYDAVNTATDEKELKVARKKLKKARAAEMSKLQDARIAARNAVDGAEDVAARKRLLPPLRLARQTIQAFKKKMNQVDMSAKTCGADRPEDTADVTCVESTKSAASLVNSKESDSIPDEVVCEATLAIDAVETELKPFRDAVIAVKGPDRNKLVQRLKAAEREALQQFEAAVCAAQAAIRNVDDPTESEVAKLQLQLQLAEVTMTMFKQRVVDHLQVVAAE